MSVRDNLEEKLQDLGQAIGSDRSLIQTVMSRINAETTVESRRLERRFTMSRLVKLAAVAALIIVALLAVRFLDKSLPITYAFDQTVEAVKNVRFMHVVQRDETGQIKDERWIEIGTDGFQVRYRQDNPPNRLIIEDGQTVSVYYKDKNTIILYDPKDQQYQWIGNLRIAFNELGGQSSMVIEKNIDYWGRKAHHVRWLKLNQDCYIDPKTKLPIAMLGYQISYEDPPENIFDIVIPKGVVVVDKKPGAAPVEEPEWMKIKKSNDELAQQNFDEARMALAAGEYQKAAGLFKKVVEIAPANNWAWFWLGKAHYELGQYDSAIYEFSKVIDIHTEHKWVPHYCYLARGLAYAAKGIKDMARRDFNVALPIMIEALRNIKQAMIFDYADDPLYQKLPEDKRPTAEQSLAKMIKRLRIVTGQNFGYNPSKTAAENQQAIAAWEDWFKNSGQIKFTPDAELIQIPARQEHPTK